MKILLAGILGGIVMFIWTSIAHMALPLGEAGIRENSKRSGRPQRNAEQYRRTDRPLYFSGSRRWQQRNSTGKERSDETRGRKTGGQPLRHSHVSRPRSSVHAWQMARD